MVYPRNEDRAARGIRRHRPLRQLCRHPRDEHRQGYISHKPNIKAAYPFIDDGIVKADVFRILEDSVGIPDYYRWRSRSGCYFCFFQRRDEWIGLAENHPDLFEQAKQYEKVDPETGKLFTWGAGDDVG